MKNLYLATVVFLALAMMLLPLTAGVPGKGTSGVSSETESDDESKPQSQNNDEKTFSVYNSETNETSYISEFDYVVGVVSAEMSPDCCEEALKAQAVAAYTYASHKRYLRSIGKTDRDYDVSDEAGLDQSFLNEEKLKSKWQDKYDTYINRIKTAVSAVSGKLITYDGLPILAVYHSVSSGITESAKDVWGADYPYLQPADSKGDLLSPEYLSVCEFSLDNIKSLLKDTCELDENPGNWFKNQTRSSSGMVLSCRIGNSEKTGVEIRKALNLHSANFFTEFNSDVFKFTVYGYGHGIGMSQYGANYMALQGCGYEEILNHYYTDCVIK